MGHDMFAKGRADEEYIKQQRRHFHRYPELSGQEEKTAEHIYQELKKMGIDQIRRDIAGHGITAMVGTKGSGATVALRADMDALPISEQTGVSFRSENKGVMHACGHDSHMAMLLGAAKILKSQEDALGGQVILLFQPAEENSPIGGAKPMIEAGALAEPNPDAIFGLHVWPQLMVGQVGVKSGFFMGASDRFTVRIKGNGGHASMPHESLDAAIVAVHVAQALQTIVSRNVNPLDAGVVTIGKIEAGTRYNVIAGEAVLEGTIRSFKPEVRKLMEERFYRIVQDIVHSFGAQVQIDYQQGYPVLENDSSMVEVIRDTAERLNLELPEVQPALVAEDFAVYLKHFPGSFFWLGCGQEDPAKTFPLHHPQFLIDERALPLGAEMLAEAAYQYLLSRNV
jgi:amidohydrolase